MSATVVCTPLRVEYLALRCVVRSVRVTRTGMGPERSAASARRLAHGSPAVLVAGLAGSLRDDVRPGDVVVATEVRDPAGQRRPCTPGDALAVALRRTGLTVHTGPIVSSRTLTYGGARAALGRSGALAVDMESLQLAAAAGGGFAVVRVIVDAPGAPLLRPGTLVRGLRALRTLRAAGPAIDGWGSASDPPETVASGPVGVTPPEGTAHTETMEVI